MVEVILVFTGLCSYVPSDVATTTIDSVQVLLVKPKGDSHSNPHSPVILIHEDFINGYHGFTPTMEGTHYRFDLKHDYVALRPKPESCDSQPCVTLPDPLTEEEDELCPTNKNRDKIHWIGRMDRVTKDDGTICHGCYSKPHKFAKLVAAAFLLDHGHFSTAHISQTPSNRPYLWEIDREGPDFQQALADLVQLETSFPDTEKPYLEFRKRKNGDVKARIYLKTSKSPVIVEVKNVPEKQVCPQEKRVKCILSHSSEGKKRGVSYPCYEEGDADAASLFEDLHFKEMYRHLEKKPTKYLGGLDCKGICNETVSEWDHWKWLCRTPPIRFNDPQCPGSLFTAP